MCVPLEFWPAAAGALLTTTIAVVLILIDSIGQYQLRETNKTEVGNLNDEQLDLELVFLAFGTVMVSGHELVEHGLTATWTKT